MPRRLDQHEGQHIRTILMRQLEGVTD